MVNYRNSFDEAIHLPNDYNTVRRHFDDADKRYRHWDVTTKLKSERRYRIEIL